MDSTINGLKNELENLTDNDLLILWASGKTQKMKASKLKDYFREKVMKFQPGETYGNPPNAGYTTEYPCALYNNNNSNITIVLPKSCGNLTPSWEMGSSNYMVCNGQRVDVTNNTATVRKISEYIIRIDIAGTYPNCSNMAGIFATNGRLVFN